MACSLGESCHGCEVHVTDAGDSSSDVFELVVSLPTKTIAPVLLPAGHLSRPDRLKAIF